MDLLQTFILLVDEYTLLTENNVIPAKKNKLKHSTYQELVFKIMLLRKFMMSDEDIYILKVLRECEKQQDNTGNMTINDLESDINDLFNIEISYSLPNSKIQTLYHTVTDLLYGLYLHSDAEKIENSLLSEKSTRKHLLLKFIESFEPIIYKTYDVVKRFIESDHSNPVSKKKFSVVHYSKKNEVKRNIIKSPRWSNLAGQDVNQTELQSTINELSTRDKTILSVVNNFISLIREDSIDNKKISKLLTTHSPILNNLNENSVLFKSLNNISVSSKVRYSEDLKFAYVYLFEDVEHPFSLNKPQLINNVRCIRLKRQFYPGTYKINNLVSELPSYYMSTIKNDLK